MELLLSPEHQQTYDTALSFARKEFGPLASRIDQEDEFPPDLWQKLGQRGFLGAGIPEEYGGAGGDYLSGALIGQALARVSPAISLSYGAHLNLCAHNLMRNGTEEQKRRILPKLASGKYVGALAITEPDVGSDAMGIRTTARRDGTGYRINGTKMFITNGPVADVVLFYAKTDPAAGSRGITAIFLELPAEGFEVARKLDKLGMRGSPTGELYFENVFVPEENVLGEVNQGYKVVMSGLDLERAFLSAMAVGIAEECLDLSISYAEQRTQFGAPIATYQLIQAKLADMFMGLHTARLACYYALTLAQSGKRISKEAAAAVLHASETAEKAAYEAIQIHGGYGYIKEFPVERFWRDARLGTIGGGTAEIRRLLIARELLGMR